MLPVYEAIDIVQVISKNVGHTQPWVVIANTPVGLEPYVVKLYTTLQIEQKNCVTAEVISNALAPYFSLNVPKAALIHIPKSITITKPELWQEQFYNADKRLKFATLQIQSVNQATASLDKSYFQSRVELDTLYAFDNLIKNADRGTLKTNLLIGSDAWLIDHEYSLNHSDISNINWSNFSIKDKFTIYHLFYNYLKNSVKKTKQNYFDEFQEYLRTLNINKLNPYFTQLSNEGFNSQSDLIIKWLEQVKKNSPTFVNCLKGSLV